MPRLTLALVAMVFSMAPGWSQKYGVGRPPTADEARKWDISVGPDGSGLPEGSGTAVEGKQVYERRCQRCHGAGGVGGDEAPLAGGQGTLATPKPVKTVGSYWPHATTLFDYIRRAMPYKQPGTLSDPQVYAVTAYVLHLNKIIGETEAINAKTLPAVKMPNREGFTADPRPDTGPGARRKK
jgi:cytochrome c